VWQDQSFEGVLATDWEIKNQMRTFEFTLRQGVKFHDGTPWNAEAAKWNLDLRKEAGNSSIWNNMLSCQVLDDYKIRINFNGTKNHFLVDVATGTYFVSPTSWMAAGDTFEERREWATDHPVGTGPFKLKDVKFGAYVKYERFDDYWRGKPYLDGVEFTIVPDPTVSGAMMEAGDADMYCYSDLKAAIDLGNKEGFYARYRDKHSPQGIWPQAQDPESVWYDKRVREALEYAINKEAIIKAIDMGSGQVSTMYQTPIGPEDPAYREGWGRYYDPDKAKALLDEAGLSAGFECNMTNNAATPILGDMAVMVQANLADVGIKANIETISPGQYMGYLLRGWPSGDLFIAGIPNEPIPHMVALRDLRYKDLQIPKWNHDTATTPEMNALYDVLEAAYTPETIEEAYIALIQQANDDAYGCFMMDWPDTAVMADYVHTDWISYSTKVWNADQTWMEPH
jgi:ABC-type transport system substrate-binding protein